MYGERPIDRRRAATRREILDAAWVLCRRNGLADLSLRELASSVGMRAPSLYSYFGSKDEIYDAMFADGQRELLELLAPYRDVTASRDALHAGTRAYFEFCVQDPVRYQLLFQRTIPGFEPSPASYAVAVEVYQQMAGVLAELGVTDPHLLDLWTALITGLVAQQISNEPGGDRWERLLAEAVDMFCEHAGIAATAPDTTATRPTTTATPNQTTTRRSRSR